MRRSTPTASQLCVARRPDFTGRGGRPAAHLVQVRTIETLQNSGAVKAVTSSSDRVDGDYSLSMEIRSFQIDTTNGRPAADVDIFAKLIDTNSSKVVASKGFSTRVASTSDTPTAGVAALNQALTEVLQDTSTWVSARR